MSKTSLPIYGEQSNCSQCHALCCQLLPFERGPEFSFSKAAGERCQHLDPEHICTIHEARVERGLSGCVVYDCHGAGPVVSRLAPTLSLDDLTSLFLAQYRLRHGQALLDTAAPLIEKMPSPLKERLKRAHDDLKRLVAGDPLSALHWDARGGEAEVVRLLREMGAQVGSRKLARIWLETSPQSIGTEESTGAGEETAALLIRSSNSAGTS